MNYRFSINVSAFKSQKLNPREAAAQKYLDNEVLKDCDKYVPFRYGYLVKSGVTGTVLGSGKVIYTQSYAQPTYYGIKRHFSKDKHPDACAFWFEKAKGINKSKWLNGVKNILHGGT
jgi:hypothetical protein